jgi:hypothetical protein
MRSQKLQCAIITLALISSFNLSALSIDTHPSEAPSKIIDLNNIPVLSELTSSRQGSRNSLYSYVAEAASLYGQDPTGYWSVRIAGSIASESSDCNIIDAIFSENGHEIDDAECNDSKNYEASLLDEDYAQAGSEEEVGKNLKTIWIH